MKSRKLIFLIFSFYWGLSALAQTTYTNFDDFKSAIENAKAGDEFILKDGTYTSSSITIKEVQGTAENPVIIRAENVGGVTLNAGTYMDFRKCAYITFQGFNINISEKSTTFKLQASNNIRITQNVLDGTGESYFKDNGTDRNSAVWISVQGLWDDDVTLSHNNRIDHNVFQNKQTLGNMIKIDGTNETQVSQYDIIEYNYFKNMGPRADNEMEAIRIGWSAMSESDGFCTVSNNLFEECNGDPEIISVKCNKNTISHNTFRRCEGTLSLRHGNESLIEGNFFLGEGADGTGGVRIYGSDHKIINNHFEGLTGTKWDAPITLTLGDAEEGNSGLTKHFRIERAIIANNTLVNNVYGVEIGYANQGKYSKPPRNVVMAYNTITGASNALVNYINAPVNMQWIDNIIYPTETAIAGEGVSFTEVESKTLNPNLAINNDLGYYKATESTPKYTPSNEAVGSIEKDIDGQVRSVPTQYGADEFSNTAVVYKPLEAKDVGPSTGVYLYATPSSFSLSVGGDTSAIQIQSNLNWTISTDVNWIILDKTSGSSDQTVQVVAGNNPTGLVRNGNITITSTNAGESGEISQTLVVTQLDRDPPMLEVSTEIIDAPAEGMEKPFTITSNVTWTISSTADWIHLPNMYGQDNKTLTISIAENTSLSKRSGEIVITDSSTLVKTVQVNQLGAIGTEIKLDIISATASVEQSGNEAANTIDGSTDNRWSGEGDGAYIVLDLGATQNVSYVKVGLYKGDSRTSSFDVLVSKDNVNFIEALMGVTSELTDEKLVIYDFDNSNARYIKIIGHGNSSNAWNSYTEFEVWGWSLNTGINNLQAEEFTFASPNPSNGTIHINGIEAAQLGIYSLNGKLLKQIMVENGQTIETGLAKGVYIARLKSDQQYFTQKLIIE